MTNTNRSFRIGPLRIGSAIAAALLSTLSNAAAAQYSVTNVTYNAFNTSTAATCDRPKNAVVYVPGGSATAKYPVHIYLTGTDQTYNDKPNLDLIAHTTARGYISATVQYDNTSWDLLRKNSCTSMSIRSGCIFSGTQSALGKICALPQADCSKGVIVSGFSQGAGLAALAKNHDSRVRAALALGVGDILKAGVFTVNYQACLDDGKRVLPSSNLRVVTADSDNKFGATEAGVRAQLARITGIPTCTTRDCVSPDGRSYYIVNSTDLSTTGTPATAEHAFYRENNDPDAALNWYYECGDEPWALHESYDWLASFGDTESSVEPAKAVRCASAPY